MKHAERILHIPNRIGPDIKFGVERCPAYPVQDENGCLGPGYQVTGGIRRRKP